MRAPYLLALLAMTSCMEDPVGNYGFGLGDPVRGAALYAPQRLGNTSSYVGRPADAALAAAQLEFLTHEFATNPRYMHDADPTVTLRLDMAQREMRGALGIAQGAPAPIVIGALREASFALAEGSLARAEAALSGPAFTAGPQMTLQRLSTLPYLPRVSEAAGAVAAEINRLDRTGPR